MWLHVDRKSEAEGRGKGHSVRPFDPFSEILDQIDAFKTVVNINCDFLHAF